MVVAKSSNNSNKTSNSNLKCEPEGIGKSDNSEITENYSHIKKKTVEKSVASKTTVASERVPGGSKHHISSYKSADSKTGFEELLTFEPFCPSVLCAPKKENWIKRKIKSAGNKATSTISKWHFPSSRAMNLSSGYDQNSNFSTYSTIRSATTTKDRALNPEDKRCTSQQVNFNYENSFDLSEIDIISYSSVKSPTKTLSLALSSELSESQVLSPLADMPQSSTESSQIDNSKEVLNKSTKIETTEEDQVLSNNVSLKLSAIEQYMLNEADLNDYVEKCARVARAYTESVGFKYEELAQKCSFDPSTFSIDDPSPLQQLKNIELDSPIKESKSSTLENADLKDAINEKKNPCKKVGFVDSSDFEIQVFDINLPPSATEKNKSSNYTASKTGVLSQNPKKFSFDDDYAQFEDISNLGPIPFPDIPLKERMIALFELIGAPEEFKKCTDLRLSLFCLYPCLTKLLGFLWNAINTGLKENEYLREIIRTGKRQQLSNTVEFEAKQSEFSKLTSLHVQKLNQLENALQEQELENAKLQCQNDGKFKELNNAIEGMTGVLKEFFCQDSYQQWDSYSRERIDSLMIYLDDICSYFSSLRKEILVQLEVSAQENKRGKQYQNLLDNFVLLERENESLKATASAYRHLQDIIVEKSSMIDSLENENVVLKNKLSKKTQELESVIEEHEREVERLCEMPKFQRARALEFWEKTHYEDALTSKEEEVKSLMHRISTLDQVLENMKNELRNTENRYNGLETKVAVLSNENLLLKIKHEEMEKQKDIEIDHYKSTAEKTIAKMQNLFEKTTSNYHHELEKYRRNYEKTINRALKVTIKAESALKNASKSKSGSSSKALSYLMNKRNSLQKFKELLDSNQLFIPTQTLSLPYPKKSSDINGMKSFHIVDDHSVHPYDENKALYRITVDNGVNDSSIEPKLLDVNYVNHQDFKNKKDSYFVLDNGFGTTKTKYRGKQLFQRLRQWKQDRDVSITEEANSDFFKSSFSTQPTSNIAQLSTKNWLNALNTDYNISYVNNLVSQ